MEKRYQLSLVYPHISCRFFSFLIIAVILLSPYFSNITFAADVTLAWDANTEPDHAGHKLYYGTSSGIYTAQIDTGNVTTFTVPDLNNNPTYYFAATAYDEAGNESAYSEEISYTVTIVDTEFVNIVAIALISSRVDT